MGKQSLKEVLRDIIGIGAFKILIWSLRTTPKRYWYSIYKMERDRMCIDKSVNFSERE